MVFAGLDVGTTGAKITLFESDKELRQFYEPYQSSRSAEYDEIDATIILNAVKKIIVEAYSYRKDLRYIGVTSFGETFVLLDKNDRVLSPSILYNDVRGKEETQTILSKISREEIGRITGLMVHEMFSLPKLLYTKNHRPDLFARADKVLLIQDYIVYMLTGVRQIDYSLASRTMLFDVNNHEWSDRLFSLFDLDKKHFSMPVKTGSIAGKMKLFDGIDGDITIINVAHDQVSVAIGSGLHQEGDAIDGCGTCECLIPFLSSIPKNRMIYDDGFGVVPYIYDNTYVSYPLIFSGGALIEWFVKTFAKGKNDPYRYYEDTISDFSPSRLLVSPHFLGSGTPFMNSSSKSFIYGLDISSTLDDIYKGILEGVAYEMRINLEELRKCGISVNHLFANGGGSKNKKWLQMKANILNVPITRIENYNAGTVGGAIVVGTSIGVFKDYQEGTAKLVKTGETYLPDAKIHRSYEPFYALYKKLVFEKERSGSNGNQ